MSTLGKFIKSRRSELGLTQEELADRVGVGVRQADISRLENNHVNSPRLSRIEGLAEALDVPVGVLLARSGWIDADEEAHELSSPETPQSPVTVPPSTPNPIPEAIEKLNQVKELVEEVEEIIEGVGGTASAASMNARS